MARGHLPTDEGYKHTENNSRHDHNDSTVQNGASGGFSNGKDSRTGQDLLTEKGGKLQQAEQLTVDQTKVLPPVDYFKTDSQCSKQTGKVLPSRPSIPRSTQHSTVSSPSPFLPAADVEEDCDTDTPCTVQTNPIAVLLSRAVNREGTNFAEETQPSQPVQGDRVISYKSPSHLQQSTDVLGELPLEELNKRQHQERLNTRIGDCDKCDNGFHPTVVHDFDSHQGKEKDVLKACGQKVGQISCSTCSYLGTCFRIGDRNIVTCRHVIYSKCLQGNHDITAIFYKQELSCQSKLVYKLKEIPIRNADVDIIILKLDDNGRGFPPAFTKFNKADYTIEEYLVYIAFFQKNLATNEIKLAVNCNTVRLKDDKLDSEHLYDQNLEMMEKFPCFKGELPYGYSDEHRKSGSVLLLSDVTHGGSGGVGIFLDASGDPVVDFVYCRGYPSFYYITKTETALKKFEKQKFPACWRMETGIKVKKGIEISDPTLWQSDN
ncbi:uncharacterized protein LOC132557852 [Ylistrum balloti]|uniref:uncharacterized protein LOC132557852 n=1 Tax=Ylistrum balloti TaxID=509963 RepID=UPI002905D999|nr:uncharacterized protein LOC132557852 [Ylistrum balloti]